MKTHLLAFLSTGVNRTFCPNTKSGNNGSPNAKSPKLNFLIFLLALILLVLGQKGYSQTNTWNGGGGNNWSSGTRWSLNHVPTASEDVVVPNNKTLNVDMAAVCKSFTISSGNNGNTVTITGTNSLTVSDDINIQAPSVLGTKTISVGTGILTCDNIILANTPLLTAVCSVTASTGTINVSGNITMNGATAENVISFSGAGTLNIGGDMTGGTFTCGTSTVNCNTNSTQTMSGGYTFYNLRVNKTAASNTVDFSVPVTVNNDFTINVGNALITGTTANYTVTNDVIIAPNGTFINTVDYASTTRVLNVGGDWTNNGGTFTAGTGTINFNTTTANQAINGTAATQTFNNITLNKSGRQLSVAGSTTTVNLNGTMTLTAGTFVAGTASNINASDDWVNNGGAFIPGTGTVTFNNTIVAQNIRGTAASQTFNNIVVNKSGQQLNVAGSTATLNLNGTMTLTAGTFAAGTASAINVAGNWNNNGASFTAGSGTVTFNGSTGQTIGGSTITTFNNLALSNTNGLTLNSIDVNISGAAGALSFSNGKITTGSNKVILGSSSTISGAGTGKYVYGNLQMGVATGSPTRVFEIGDASVYAPVSVVFNSVTVAGNVTGYTVGTEHPSILSSTIDESKSVNRYWSLVNSGVSLTSYTPTFNWVAGDVDAGSTTSNFIIGRRTSSWAYPTMGTRNPTNCTTTLTSFGTYACGEGGASVPVITTNPADQTACSGSSLSYTAIANDKPTSTVVWEVSTNNGATFSTLTIASPYSVTTSTVSGVTTSTLTINPVAASMDGYSYRAVYTNTRGSAASFDGLLTVNVSPTANAGSALSPICGSGSSAPLGGSIGGSATSGTWSTPAGGTFSPSATTLNATWTPPGGYTGTATLTLTTSGGSCGSATASKTQVVTGAAGAVSITPSSASICVNAIQLLVASNTETSTYSSGTVNVAIPDNSAAGATNTIAVSGIPTGATVTGISVTINVTHTKDQDLIMNLRAPNGNILNLINTRGGSGSNFTNTVINSTSSTAITGSAPFTGTFKPDATNGVGATGQVSNVTAFSSLYSTANGNWVFSARDQANSNTGTISSWTIAITYIDPITWSPVTYLYTNAAATTAYTAGTVAATVYAKPSAAGTYTYTATATNSGGCTSTQTVTVTAGPIVTITPDYCYGSGYIQLNASSTPAASSWLWNTGATTSSILVNLAGNYTVTATTAGGCVASITSPIAQELVVNGDFSSGNTGFTSAYGYVSYTTNSMYPEAVYTVGPNPNLTHGYFFGKDHTTGSGNLLIVNGSGSPVSIWQQTIAVQPNTTYYFSAWAMSLNDVSPYAQLQFDINGSGIGTTAVLPAGPNSTSAAYSWVQFYGSWTSGAGVTSATVSIKDLQTALGGNDFGIDDISFGTLATFVSLSSASGTDAQTVCTNSPITNITYSIGSGSGGPSVTGLPTGLSYSFSGTTLTISGTPTTAGTYTYTVTTSSCNPITKTGTITVNDETISLSSAAGTNAQTPCLNSAITNITYAVGGLATGATVSGLPTGVTGSYSGGVFTISGTPTAAGTYTYIVTTTGSCNHATATGTMNVRRQIITRTSAAGTNAQAVCVNTAITNITYAIGGTATGAGVTGLPAGVSGSFSGGVFTISGSPAVAGTYTYTVTTTGTCNAVTAGGTITVNGPTFTLTSAVGTDAQTVCANTAITDITYNVGGTATGAGIAGLPAGVSGSYSLGVFTISGTPTATGVFNYTITSSGGSCGTTTVNGTITVNGTNTITLSSAAGTDAQTKCINTAITNITYSTIAATGATFSGLPTGVSGGWAANVVTISGTPTVAGTSTYTITLTGGCGSVNTTGTIAITANNTAGAASSTPTLCINTALTAITHTTTGATGIANSGVSGANGLPAGVSATWASNTITISGTPTASGTFNYSIALTGGCGSVNATGTITVTAANTAGAASSTPTLCISTALTAITHTTTGATGISNSGVSGANGLPAGVSATWASNTITISGTPTASGTFNYSIALTGGCGSVNATGTITVAANKTAGAASSTPTLCINTALTAITHTTTGATGISNSGVSGANGLPAGVSATWASNTITISGTPTASGTFNYSIALTGGCGSVNATGTITVTAANTAGAASSTPTLCISTALTAITHTTTGATGISNSGVSGANGLPAGVSATWASNTITISGTPTASGTFNYSIALTGGCGSVNATGTITVTANKTAGAASSTPTLCISTALTAITHTTTGATGIANSGVSGANGLPAGVSATWASNTITISGTPTASGTFNYSIALTGGCGSVNATGTITVTANKTAGAASSTPTLCISTALTAITHTTTGATGISNSGVSGANGLPAGVSATWASNTITISGTPTASGTFNYSIALTGGCGSVNATGTITVTAANTAGAASSTPTLCISTALTAITHTTTGATGISNSGVSGANGLPAGVSATWASNTITISGTPTASGTFNYSIALTGGCGSVNATGTITVTANKTAGAASSTPTLCINTALTAITHTTTGATGISNSGVSGANGLPAGVSATWASNTITISGTPTASGTFNYSIALTGGCGTVNATGTITVTANNTAGAASSTPTLCINTALTAITHTTTGATGIANSGVSGANGLPAGVSATWASNTITISGTPTASGTFNYSIALTGGCGSVNATGTITVTAANTAGAASSTPTLCISTALTAITHTTTGATGISNSGVSGANGLPTGVSATWASNTITISGTPTASGTFNYSIALTGGCGSVNATGTITVTANKTAGAASSTPTLCINTALTAVTHTTTGATGISNSGVSGANGLPAGVSATWASNTITISGTPTASGTFNYSIALTGGCGTANATGTITVTANKTAGAASSTPTLCINTALTAITHTTTGATGISNSGVSGANGLPAGVSATWASNTITISGTPTASGTFNYSIALTGGCGSVNATGTITVTANKTAGAASSTPTLCINTALTAITHTTTGATGISNSGVSGANGLPAGVSATWASNTITISGTPTASGTFNYSIALTGGCGSVNATGTITVTAANTAGAASSTPTLCISTALTAITHTTTGATGISNSGVSGANGLPAGVSATWASNTITISGTPTASGTFNYSIALTGGCGSVNATGTITVTANKTAGAASSTPTLCINTALTAITHTTTGATGIANSGVSGANGLPAGVSATWASNTITISGTPTASGTFNYSIALTGGCGTVSATGTITVHASNTATLSSSAGTDAQTVCINSAITNITYAIGGSATSASVSGLPAGVNGSYSAGVYTISGTPTASGTFNYTVTTTGGSCAAATANGSITVSPTAVGGTIADVSICYADNGTLTLTGNVGGVVRWETSNDLSTWTNISNTTTSQSFSGLTRTTWYRALVQSGACASTTYSNSAKVGIHNLWTGDVSSDWNTGANWSDGLTPTTSCPDVTIPVLTGPAVYPQLTSGTATVNNIIIYPNATMIVANATLQVAGTITNNGTLDITQGTLVLNGTAAAQTIAGSTFYTHTIQNLGISNGNGVSLANTNDTMRITGVLSFGANNAVLNTNDNLTLVSNAAGTASVGDLTNGGTITGTNITGNATVERYIPNHPKAWQFLSVPTSGQSIKNAWQEGNTTLGNNRPGYGTIITGEMSAAIANGFDIYTPTGPSMKTYNPATNGWVGVANMTMQIANNKGYMFFIRGDRSVTAYNQAATATTMRTTGKLYTFAADAPPTTTVLGGKMESIGNPYASAIDFRNVSKPAAPDVDDVFYVWDPLLTNNYYGLGGYQTISAVNSWKPIPGGTVNYDANVPNPYIQSGQAFLVHATGAGGTMSFSESNKVNQYSMVNRPVTRMADRQFMRLSLTTTGMVSDGTVVAFDSDFSNAYDANDAIKLPNSSESFAVKKDNYTLALEARSPVAVEDTVFYTFSNLRRPSYTLKFKPENMPVGLTAYLVDKYLGTNTQVSTTDSTSIDFTLSSSIPASVASDRFYMIFRQALPPAITSITAGRANSASTAGPITVNWTVAHEANIVHYEVDRSIDGVNFTSLTDADPVGNNSATYNYSATDISPLRGTNYYMVKGTLSNGTTIHSAVVRVAPGKNQSGGKEGGSDQVNPAITETPAITKAAISVYPNPVVDKTMHVQFTGQEKGVYKLELFNKQAQSVYSANINIDGTNHTETIQLQKAVATGQYQIKITSPVKTTTVQQVIIQ